MSAASFYRDAEDLATALGYTVHRTKGNHLSFWHPAVPKPIFTSSTPGDRRVIDNLRARLRRALRTGATA